jgi:hypothetical protein
MSAGAADGRPTHRIWVGGRKVRVRHAHAHAPPEVRRQAAIPVGCSKPGSFPRTGACFGGETKKKKKSESVMRSRAPKQELTRIKVLERLARGTLGALLVAAAGAGGADDNHATALAAVLVGGHFDVWYVCVCMCVLVDVEV